MSRPIRSATAYLFVFGFLLNLSFWGRSSGVAATELPSRQDVLTLAIDPPSPQVIVEKSLLACRLDAWCTDPAQVITLTAADLPSFVIGWDSLSYQEHAFDLFGIDPGVCDSGHYHMTFSATTDSGLADTIFYSLRVVNVNMPPSADGGPNKTTEEGVKLCFDVVAGDPDTLCGNPEDTITWSYWGEPFNQGATVGPGMWRRQFCWTPPQGSMGTYNVNFMVTDPWGLFDIDTVLIVVDTVHTLRIFVDAPTTMNEGVSANVVVTATDTRPFDLITLAAFNLPHFASGWDGRSGTSPVVDTVHLSPDFCDADPFYNFWFEAECSGGLYVASVPITLSVEDINRPPSLGLPATQAVLEGDTLDFVVTAVDHDHVECGDTLILEAWNLPSGAEFFDSGDGRGLFHWPGASPGGDYYVSFRAYDGIDADTGYGPVKIIVVADTLDFLLMECGRGFQGQVGATMAVLELLHTTHDIVGIEVRARLQPFDIGQFTEVVFSPIFPQGWSLDYHVTPDTSWVINILALDTSGTHPLLSSPEPQHLVNIYGAIVDSIRDPQTGYPIPLPDTTIDILLPEGNIRISDPGGIIEWYPPPVQCFFEVSSEFISIFVRADAQSDGDHDIFDAIYLLNWLGGIAPQPPCIKAVDAQDDGDPDVFDALRILNWLGGVAPAPPAPCCIIPINCGSDPTPDGLSCNSYAPCFKKVGDKTVIVGSAEASQLVVEDDRVILTNAEAILGFSFTLEYDPELLTAKAVETAGLVTEEFDFFVGGLGESGVIRVVALRDLDMSNGVERLPAGTHQVARIVFEGDHDASLQVVNSVMAIDADRALSHHVVVKGALPSAFALGVNYPNPFNTATEIRYTLPEDCQVKLTIYNLLGQEVVTLVDDNQSAGRKTIRWDSRGQTGNEVSSGLYLYRLQAGDFVETRKMILLR